MFNNMIIKIKKEIKDHHKIIRKIPDSQYLKIRYWLSMGKLLDLKDPKTYNEKLNWLKLNDRNPKYTNMVDKYEVRKYIENTIGNEYLIPLLGVYNSFEEIDFNILPSKFVLKPNHTSGDYFICTDKSKIDYYELKDEVNKWLKREYYWEHREWPYKNVKPRIVCEKYLEDDSKQGLKDYKFFCFDGKPKFNFIATDRATDTRFDFFDMEFNHLPVEQGYKNSDHKIMKPKGFERMSELASQLSKDIPHVRVDFYYINEKIFFGEMTFYHFSGTIPFEPQNYDSLFGSYINLEHLN